MKKPKPINQVLQAMTFGDFVSTADRDYREAMANEQLAKIEAEIQLKKTALEAARAAENARILGALDRPEYISAKHAQRKEKKIMRYRTGLTRKPPWMLLAELRMKKRRAAAEQEKGG